jgi:hypothetical protein
MDGTYSTTSGSVVRKLIWQNNCECVTCHVPNLSIIRHGLCKTTTSLSLVPSEDNNMVVVSIPSTSGNIPSDSHSSLARFERIETERARFATYQTTTHSRSHFSNRKRKNWAYTLLGRHFSRKFQSLYSAST